MISNYLNVRQKGRESGTNILLDLKNSSIRTYI